MGYYTYYTLSSIKDPKDEFESFMKELGKESGCWDGVEGPCDCLKWYDWDEDCTKVSKRYPELLVEITGDGEGPEDFWYARIKNGHIEYHESIIVYPPIINTDFMSDEEILEAKGVSYHDRIFKLISKQLGDEISSQP